MTAEIAGAVYEAYGRALHSYLMRRLANAETARDLAQETYVRLLRVPHDDLIRAPQAYVFRIASNLVYELRARQHRDIVRFDSPAVEFIAEQARDPTAGEPGERIDIERQLANMLAQLPPLYAAILVMKKRDGLSMNEIAAELGISIHTVKKYLYRAIALARAAKWER
jgi:RNA polymerase sigma-70 factor (ECF subfamily)